MLSTLFSSKKIHVIRVHRPLTELITCCFGMLMCCFDMFRVPPPRHKAFFCILLLK
uniref:Uncharacterized protein n=1 Tax=Physcomitrium patens TaxID=3218 RepID=A0A2K1L7M0_PHYPA|nr:hypothetical protein PHYPA_000441 [Physcomitrium patens]